MKRHFLAAVSLAACLLAPLVASAALSTGTQLVGTMDQSISSKDAQVGQTFTLSNVHSLNHDLNGATVYGHVSSVQRAGQGTTAKIGLAYDKVNTRSGNVYKIAGATKDVQVNTKSNALKEIGAAAGGALIGGLLGGKIGAVLGGGGGYLYAKNSRENVSIPQNSTVTFIIEQSRHQAAY